MRMGMLFDERYVIKKVIGSGGCGKVYLAENVNLGTMRAIKEIPVNESNEAQINAEINAMNRLRHDALPRIYDMIRHGGAVYIIEDYFEGETLDKVLEGNKTVDEETGLAWAFEICDVLEYLHGQKPNPIIYRDLKPSNIILSKDGSLKLVDFGSAREYKDNGNSDTIYIGTRGYASPEQYGFGQTSVKSDIFSFGMTMFHLITGIEPLTPGLYETFDELSKYIFGQEDVEGALLDNTCEEGQACNSTLARRILNEETISFQFLKTILKCVEREPSKRYGDVGELKNVLESLNPGINPNAKGGFRAKWGTTADSGTRLLANNGGPYGCGEGPSGNGSGLSGSIDGGLYRSGGGQYGCGEGLNGNEGMGQAGGVEQYDNWDELCDNWHVRYDDENKQRYNDYMTNDGWGVPCENNNKPYSNEGNIHVNTHGNTYGNENGIQGNENNTYDNPYGNKNNIRSSKNEIHGNKSTMQSNQNNTRDSQNNTRDSQNNTRGNQNKLAHIPGKCIIINIPLNHEFGCELAWMSAKLCQQRTLVLDLAMQSGYSGWYFKTEENGLAAVCVSNDPFKRAIDIIEGSDEKTGSVRQGLFLVGGASAGCAPKVLSPGMPKYLKSSANWPEGLFLMNSSCKGNYRVLYPKLTENGCGTLFSLISELTSTMDVCIVLTDCSEHNILTVASMNSSHYVLAALRPDVCGIREYANIVENPGFGSAAQKVKFVAWEDESKYFLNAENDPRLRDGDIVGTIRMSKKRLEFRCAEKGRPYASAMEKTVQGDYKRIFDALGIVDRGKLRKAAYF